MKPNAHAGALSVLSTARLTTLLSSLVVALASGTNYVRRTVLRKEAGF